MHFTNYSKEGRNFKEYTIFDYLEAKDSIEDDASGTAHHWIYYPEKEKVVKKADNTDKKQKVRVYIDPTAGSMAAYLTLNGKGITFHHLKPPNEGNLAEYTLNPGEKKNVNIKTIPISGSNYPAKICVGLNISNY